jgi:hypothetical protein
MLVFWGTFAPAMGLPAPKGFVREEAVKDVERALKFLNSYYLKETPFICKLAINGSE